MNLSNKKVQTFVERRAQEPEDQTVAEWPRTNRQLVMRSAVALYHRLVPGGQLDDREILDTVTTWSFQRPLWMSEMAEDESELSMVEEGKTQSVLEIEKRIIK